MQNFLLKQQHDRHACLPDRRGPVVASILGRNLTGQGEQSNQKILSTHWSRGGDLHMFILPKPSVASSGVGGVVSHGCSN